MVIEDHGVGFCGDVAGLGVVLLTSAALSELVCQYSLLSMKEDVVVLQGHIIPYMLDPFRHKRKQPLRWPVFQLRQESCEYSAATGRNRHAVDHYFEEEIVHLHILLEQVWSQKGCLSNRILKFDATEPKFAEAQSFNV